VIRKQRKSWEVQSGAEGSGFTLVELLVVIGIIALLIAILLPALNKMRKESNRLVCLSNVRQLGTGVLMYCNDNEGWFPTCAYWKSTAYVPYEDDWLHWQANRKLEESAIAKYLGGNKKGERFPALLRCPADTFEGRKAALGISAGQGPYMFSYNMNDSLGRNIDLTIGPQMRTKILQWHATSRKIMLTEILDKWNTGPAWAPGINLTRRHGTAVSRGNAYGPPGRVMGAKVSAVFMDGHAGGVDDDVGSSTLQMSPTEQ
jgi:prepilin-type N-terminal cleavage/methylation domain-containing protein